MNTWSGAIKIAAGNDKPVVCYSPDGKLYVVYGAGQKIRLSSYDGTKVAFEKDISESAWIAYEQSMYITKQGHIHIVWIECANYGDDEQFVKYRFYDGANWSEIIDLQTLNIPGTLPGGFIQRKVEDLRMAVDDNGNVFIVYTTAPVRVCKFISKYGSNILLENWPMANTSKHADVAVDADYVHVAWQQKWPQYTIAYCKRPNVQGSAWKSPIDVKDGVHRPRIAVDSNKVPHVFHMDDFETARVTVYKYWTGNGFSPKFIVSDDAPRAYNNIGLSVFDKDNIFTMELCTSGNFIFYNWLQNGKWTGHKQVPGIAKVPDGTSCALSPDGKTAVVAYTSRSETVYINVCTSDTPPPPPAECQIGETKTETCWDGSVIITQNCIDGKWVATGAVCPVKPPDDPVTPDDPKPKPTTTCGTTAWGHFKRLNIPAWWAHIRGKHDVAAK